MRLISIAACLSASALAFAAPAQVTNSGPAADPALSQPSDQAPPPPPPAPADQAPPPGSSDSAAPSAYSANATPPGATVQMGPQQPVVQAAPQPTGQYPRCTRAVKDNCTNPGSR